jgi:hypothetical protein
LFLILLNTGCLFTRFTVFFVFVFVIHSFKNRTTNNKKRASQEDDSKERATSKQHKWRQGMQRWLVWRSEEAAREEEWRATSSIARS